MDAIVTFCFSHLDPFGPSFLQHWSAAPKSAKRWTREMAVRARSFFGDSSDQGIQDVRVSTIGVKGRGGSAVALECMSYLAQLVKICGQATFSFELSMLSMLSLRESERDVASRQGAWPSFTPNRINGDLSPRRATTGVTTVPRIQRVNEFDLLATVSPLVLKNP